MMFKVSALEETYANISRDLNQRINAQYLGLCLVTKGFTYLVSFAEGSHWNVNLLMELQVIEIYILLIDFKL